MININANDEKIHIFRLVEKNVVNNGKIKAISTSKIMNKIAIKKNRIENGICAELKKLNPHSNGIIFSRQFFLFLEKVDIIIIKIILNVNIVKTKFIIIKIKS